MGAGVGCLNFSSGGADDDKYQSRAQRVQACPWNPDNPNAKLPRAKRCGA